MKQLLTFTILLFFVKSQAQCGISNVCNANTGIFSNNNTTDIAYDNMGSGFHSTYIKDTNSIWKVWGEAMDNDGVSHVLSPKVVDVANYPALTGTIYKMGIGSSGIYNVQLIVLTSTGLFVSGKEGIVLDNSITSSSTFQKIAINGKQDGLPANITPADVKMMFVTSGAITITTCTGEVFVIALNADIRGNGSVGNATQWYQVMENPTTPLTNVIVARGDYQTAFAIKANGTLWSWGSYVFLGNGSSENAQIYASQMVLPAGLSGVKMIQAAHYFTTSYYVLATDKKLYALGENNFGQLGDGSSIDRTVWVNATNPDGSVIADAAWISANEHDDYFDAIAVIKTSGLLYTAGSNSRYMVGRAVADGINYFDIPAGVLATDVITYAETGGHTCALIKQGSPRYGYVGHRISGSIGDGSNSNMIIQSYDFITPPIINVCGTSCITPTISVVSPICTGQNAVFTITSSSGDLIDYNINNGPTQTITIGSNNMATIAINNVSSNQVLNLTHLLNQNGTCNLALTYSATIIVSVLPITPTFTQVSPICEGTVINPLPIISNNGIAGSWSPNLDNTVTTTYTFTPNLGLCATTKPMTIVVNPKALPIFNQISVVCYNNPPPILPTTSLNGIVGSWQPPIINNTLSGSYQFTPNSNQCSLLPPPLHLTISNDFDFEIIHKCIDSNYTLEIVPLNNSFNINSASFSWTYNSSSVGVNNQLNVTNHLIVNNITAQFPLSYFATVILPNGCFKRKTTSLTSTFCNIQKGISPNNDNLNDFFDLRLMDVQQLKIYNRYGLVVYTKENYTNQWIGQTDEGQDLPSGTYYYVIEFNANKPATVGWIYINREQ